MANHVLEGSWKRRWYPAQSCGEKSGSSDHSTLLSQPEEQLPQFPTTIRAVQDSRSSSAGSRTLVICLDGTGDQFDNDNSNVVNFVACLKKDGPSQLTYYQSGIGTYDGHGLKNGISAVVDMAVGSGLGIHIKGAYRFLMQNYREGDKICLLGFSRGAYTVRCLTGMLHKVGLLPAHNSAQISFAYSFYKNDTPEGWKLSAEFKRTFCTNVQVYFVGLWDCVASVGFIPRMLPFSKTPTNTIHYFRHAMALDEHRAKFKVLQWQHEDPKAGSPSTIDNTPKGKVKAEKDIQIGRIGQVFRSCFGREPTAGESGAADHDSSSHISLLKQTEKEREQKKLEVEFDKDDVSVHERLQTDVLEVWFAGAHADVGGGAVRNDERHMLSRVPLRWMIRQCFECNTGILFDTASLAEVGVDIPAIWPVYIPRKKPLVGPSPGMVEQYEAEALPPIRCRSTALGVEREAKRRDGDDSITSVAKSGIPVTKENGTRGFQIELLPEHVEDHFDAMAPINDQLELTKGWWVLEFLPVKVDVLKQKSEQWENVVRMNLGRYRGIKEEEPKMHWTVQMRMSDKAYKVRNRAVTNTIWKIAA